ncbi:diguanylate cyclase [Paenibacillus sp.]|uniref:sensor domain-containing diguanylate cyclase n=1 Tax=Paenibacillus sp. TaxID=58172 RepID=UPI002D45EE4D|nr:diguanylate cyclase [Paenibacillus sp.]HZG86860.1 diguanylate cyclase [Paenibacillus sp.]
MSSLRIKLPISVVLLISVAIVLSGAATYSFSSALLIRKSEDEIRANAFRTGEAIYGLLKAEIRKSEILASQTVFRETLAQRERMPDERFFRADHAAFREATDSLRRAYDGESLHEKFWLGDKNGVVIASSSPTPESGSIRVADREYFIEAMQGKPAVSGTIVSRANGRFIIVAAAPVFDEAGRAIGVVGNSIYTSFFSDSLNGVKVNQRGELYIFDSNGTVLAHSTDETKINSRVDTPELLNVLRSNPSRSGARGTLSLHDGEIRKFYGYWKVPFADWVVVVEDDLPDIQSPLKGLALQYAVVLVASIVVLFALFTIMLSQWVTKPLRRMLGVMEAAGAGDLHARVRLTSAGEFGMLGRALNQMLAKISELMASLAEASKLELRFVAERERSRLSESLRQSMQALNSSLDEARVQQLALEELQRHVPFRRASLWVDEDGRLTAKAVLAREAVRGELSPDLAKALCRSLGGGESAAYRGRRGPVYEMAVAFDSAFARKGLFYLERDDRAFADNEADFALSYASQASVAIDNASLYRRMELMAVTDELTGMYNRRHFYRLAEEAYRGAEELGEPLTVVLFDIDHFKQINDRLGHLAGDEVLRRLRAMIGEALPQRHVLARFGGEEFALLLPGIALAEALGAAERLRAAVEQYRFPPESGTEELRVTVSVGGAAWERGMPLDTALQHADTALYRAKASGRNRVVAYASGT